MSSNQENMQDSWVEISAGSNNGNGNGLQRVQSIHTDDGMQSLLMEAQKESRNASTKGSKESSQRNSPKQLTSPASEQTTEPITASDIIWDWSSRIEPHPPKEWRFVHPSGSGSSSSNGQRGGGTGGTGGPGSGVVASSSSPTLSLRKSSVLLRRGRVGSGDSSSAGDSGPPAPQGKWSGHLLPLLFLTNLVSLVIGAGIGMYVGKKLCECAHSRSPGGGGSGSATLATFYLD